jgi:hypothetical protein
MAKWLVTVEYAHLKEIADNGKEIYDIYTEDVPVEAPKLLTAFAIARTFIRASHPGANNVQVLDHKRTDVESAS